MNDLPTIDDLLVRAQNINPQANLKLIKYAYDFADKAHSGQRRMSGEPYITHPLRTAMNLADMNVPDYIIVAGLLHDVPEDTLVTVEEIKNEFGEDVASLVNGISKVGKIKYRGVERYIENLRKMFLAMAADVRVVIIKFADRLDNLQTLDAIPQKKAYRIALESLEIYSPIANRLGMGEIKGKLEDAAFKWVYPNEYKWTEELSLQARQHNQTQTDTIIRQTKEELANNQIVFVDVHGRQKHLYSLYKKLLKYGRDISKIYDLTAVRCVMPSAAECYAALGVIHSRWTPLKGRIKDYISQPKPNGYQSLHTTVFYEQGAIVEFQFRTAEMHKAAEFGIAAHWAYDEKKLQEVGATRIHKLLEEGQIDWMEQVAGVQETIKDTKQFLADLEEFKLDAFQDRIFVYTPRGDVIELPEDATPIDFAYRIHSDIGNKLTAAKVNDAIHPLDQPLKSGDIVEIITDKNRKGPNPDWLKFAKTRNAKAKIRQHARATISSFLTNVLPDVMKKKSR